MWQKVQTKLSIAKPIALMANTSKLSKDERKKAKRTVRKKIKLRSLKAA